MSTPNSPSTTKPSTSASEAIEGVTSRIKEVGHQAGEKMGELKDSAKQTVTRRVDALGDAMQVHPILFAAGAFMLGYLYARIRH